MARYIDWEKDEKTRIAEDRAILKYVRSKVSKGAFKEICYELKECYYTYRYSITDKPLGQMRDLEEFKYIEGVYVNQTTNGGYSGDDFAGSCSIKISDKEYFQFFYSM